MRIRYAIDQQNSSHFNITLVYYYLYASITSLLKDHTAVTAIAASQTPLTTFEAQLEYMFNQDTNNLEYQKLAYLLIKVSMSVSYKFC